MIAHVANDGPPSLSARAPGRPCTRTSSSRSACGEERLELPPHGDRAARRRGAASATSSTRRGPIGSGRRPRTPSSRAWSATARTASSCCPQAFHFPAGRPLGQEPEQSPRADRDAARARRDGPPDRGQRRLAYGVRIHVAGFAPSDDAFSVEPGGAARSLSSRPSPAAAFTGGALTALNLAGRVAIRDAGAGRMTGALAAGPPALPRRRHRTPSSGMFHAPRGRRRRAATRRPHLPAVGLGRGRLVPSRRAWADDLADGRPPDPPDRPARHPATARGTPADPARVGGLDRGDRRRRGVAGRSSPAWPASPSSDSVWAGSSPARPIARRRPDRRARPVGGARPGPGLPPRAAGVRRAAERPYGSTARRRAEAAARRLAGDRRVRAVGRDDRGDRSRSTCARRTLGRLQRRPAAAAATACPSTPALQHRLEQARGRR